MHLYFPTDEKVLIKDLHHGRGDLIVDLFPRNSTQETLSGTRPLPRVVYHSLVVYVHLIYLNVHLTKGGRFKIGTKEMSN